MKYVLITAMLAGLVCVGCKPQTVQPGTDTVTATPTDTARSLTPPGGEVAPPAPPTNLTSLVPPEPKPEGNTPPATAGGTYTIKKGDTFIKIAREVYGDPSRMKDIAAANPGVEPTKLKVGQTIILPDVGSKR